MTTKLASQLVTISQARSESLLRRPNWIGTLALLGALLLFMGVSLSFAASVVEDRLLPNILKQLKDQGKKIKSTLVIDEKGEAEIVVVLADGSVRRYDKNGKTKQSIEANGKRTEYEDGLPTDEFDAQGTLVSKTTYQRWQSGKVRQSTKRSRTGIESKVFDNDGNIVQTTNSQGIKNFNNYVKDNKGKTVSYDEMNVQTGKTQKMILDPKSGEVITKIDQNGVRTDITYEKNELGEMTATIERESTGKFTIKKFDDGQLVEKVEDGVKTVVENVLNEKGILAQTVERKKLLTSRGVMEDITRKEFDEEGRVKRMQDKNGDHRYTYEVDANGRMIARHEQIQKPGAAKAVDRTTRYDAAGRIIGVEEEGKQTSTSYTLDENGNIIMARDQVHVTFGTRSFNDEVIKEYDGKGNVTAKTDSDGSRTEYTYDAHGNKLTSKGFNDYTKYFYDKQNNLIGTRSQNHKGATYTEIDPRNQLAQRKVKVNNNGVVELTTFGLNEEGKRVAYTTDAFGVKIAICRDQQSDQPETTTYIKNNGKIITTTYEYIGEHMVSSREEGPTGVTETRFNLQGRPEEALRVDQYGREYKTYHKYQNGRMSRSIMDDDKGRSTTDYNETEDPVRIVRENSVGFPRVTVEARKYKSGMLVESVSSDVKGRTISEYDEHEQVDRTHRISDHGFPAENWVTNIYDDGGDLARSIQIDNRGFTRNWFSKDGLLERTVRSDRHGHPRDKETTYTYVRGELVKSQTEDFRGISYNSFDKDGLMDKSMRIKKFSFPRKEENTYKYDSKGYMIFSQLDDSNGTTQNFYNIDEVVDHSVRDNIYGHARHQVNTFNYDTMGYMTWSKQADLRGTSESIYNIDGLATQSMRFDRYGIHFSRNTLTSNRYDEIGFMTKSLSKSLMSQVEKTFDRDSLTRHQLSRDNFGIMWGRYKISNNYVYDNEGRMKSNLSEDKTGKVYSRYDIHGDATDTLRVSNIGLGANRIQYSKSAFHSDTGMTISRVSKSDYGTTMSLDFDPILGLESRQISFNKYGLTSTLTSVSELGMDPRHGLTKWNRTRNRYNEVETHFDTETGGVYGLAVKSITNTFYGLGFTRHAEAKIHADCNTGLTLYTESRTKYADSKSYNDTMEGGLHGVAVRSEVSNHYGLGATRESKTRINPNYWNGQQKETWQENAYADTYTRYKDETDGTADYSLGKNKWGLGYSRYVESHMKSSSFTGLSTWSQAVATGANGELFSVTTTTVFDPNFGTAKEAKTENAWGLEYTTIQESQTEANTDTGINMWSRAVAKGRDGQVFSVTTTDDFDQDYGTARHTVGKNTYGLRFTNVNETFIQASKFNGINNWTRAVSKGRNGELFSVTTTDRFDRNYGTAQHAVTKNQYGLGYTQMSENHSRANMNTGISEWNKSISTGSNGELFSVTFTDKFNARYGTAEHTMAYNEYGLGLTRVNDNNLKVNSKTGINMWSQAVSKGRNGRIYSISTTDRYNQLYGTAEHTVTNNRFGLGYTQVNEQDIRSSCDTGISQFTKAVAKGENGEVYSTTTTDEFDQRYGTAKHSIAKMEYGLGFSRVSEQNTQANHNTGISMWSKSVSMGEQGDVYSTTTTDVFDPRYGTAKHSTTKNTYGLGYTRDNEQQIRANKDTGVNEWTQNKATGPNGELYSVSTTDEYNAVYGTAEHTVTVNEYGLGYTQVNEQDIESNYNTGINIRTVGVAKGKNGVVFSTTETDEFDPEYGVALHSTTRNEFGLEFAMKNESKTRTNLNTGITEWSKSVATGVNGEAFSETITDDYDPSYGAPKHSVTTNTYGLGYCKVNEQTMDPNLNTGINMFTRSVAKGANGELFSTTETDVFHPKYGTGMHSVTANEYGLLLSRKNEIDNTPNFDTGINERSESVSTNKEGTRLFSRTVTDEFDQRYGTAKHSVTTNELGLLYTRLNDQEIHASTKTGISEWTKNTTTGKNGELFSVTVTDEYDQQYGTAKHAITTNEYGLGFSQKSTNTSEVNSDTGINLKTTAVATGRNGEEFSTSVTDKFDQRYGTAEHSITTNCYGLNFAQINESEIQASIETGMTTWSKAVAKGVGGELFSTTETDEFDPLYGTAKHSTTINEYGLLFAKKNSQTIKASECTGINTWTRNVSTGENDEAFSETITDEFDSKYGTARHSTTYNEYGLGYTLVSEQEIKTNDNTGQNKWTKGESRGRDGTVYSTTTTDKFNQRYGTAEHSETINEFGLLFTRKSDNTTQANYDTGINVLNTVVTTGENGEAFSTSTTDEFDQRYGTATHSTTVSEYGLGYCKINDQEMKSDCRTGINTWSKGVSQGSDGTVYSTTETDDYDPRYGTARHAVTTNEFGVLNTRKNDNTTRANCNNGLSEYSRSVATSVNGVKFSETITDEFDPVYGTAEHSTTTNELGLMYTRISNNESRASCKTGITEWSKSTATGENGELFSTTTTDRYNPRYGTAEHSSTLNEYGLEYTRTADTQTRANCNSGLTMWSKSEAKGVNGELFSTTETDEYDPIYGTATHSVTANEYGLGYNRKSIQDIQSSCETGYNTWTKATSTGENGELFSVTTTDEFNEIYGTAEHSSTENEYGLLLTRINDVTIDPNYCTGQNEFTKSVSKGKDGQVYSTTETDDFDPEYGTAKHSITINEFGIGFSRKNDAETHASTKTGLNTWSRNKASGVDGTLYSITTTDVFDPEYGVGQHSTTENKFGLLLNEINEVSMVVDTNTGINKSTHTEARGKFGTLFSTTDTDKFNARYGTAEHSVTTNEYGLLYTKKNEQTMKADVSTGISKWTQSVATGVNGEEFSTTTTDDFDPEYGTAKHSITEGKYGLDYTRVTTTDMRSNWQSGINEWNKAEARGKDGTLFSTTETDEFHEIYGTAEHSVTTNEYGLLYSKINDTKTKASCYTGINTWSESTSKGENGTIFSVTTTDKYDQRYGTSKHSTTKNTYGLGYMKKNDVDITASCKTGINERTESTASNEDGTIIFSETITDKFNQRYGTAEHSTAYNNFGLEYSMIQDTSIKTDYRTGINTWTENTAKGYDGTVFSISTTDKYNQRYGTAEHTTTHNKFGLGYARKSDSTSKVDINTGITTWSKSITTGEKDEPYSETITDTYDPLYGSALHSITTNVYGLGYCLETDSTNDPNFDTGQNKTSTSISRGKNNGPVYSTSTTWFHDTTYGTAYKSNTTKRYGIHGERFTTTGITADTKHGLNRHTKATSYDKPDGQKLRTVETDFDTLTGGIHGVATKTTTTNELGATLGKVTTTNVNEINLDTGMNIKTTASNGLATTTTTSFDPMTGVALVMSVDNVYGAEGNKHVDTTVQSWDFNTGMTKKSKSETDMSTTYTYNTNKETGLMKDTGTQEWSTVTMAEEWSLGGGIETTNIYKVNQTTGLVKQTDATNGLGKTTTYNYHDFIDGTKAGAAWYSENWASYGCAYYTFTTFVPETQTGFNKTSTAISYSRKDAQKLSTSTTTFNFDGLEEKTVNESTTGAKKSRKTTTTVTERYATSGGKYKTHTTHDLGYSDATMNKKGVETSSTSHSNLGPTDGLDTSNYTNTWDGYTGQKRQTFSKNPLSKSFSYFDHNGLPGDTAKGTADIGDGAQGILYMERESTYNSADGGKFEKVYAGPIRWTGQPEKTFSECTNYSRTLNTMDVNGFTTDSTASFVYGGNGDCDTTTKYWVNQDTGMNIKSKTSKSTGDYTWTYYNQQYGYASNSKSYNKKDNTWTNTTNWNHTSNGVTYYSETTGDNEYKKSTNNDSMGRPSSAHTHSKIGKDKYMNYDSTYDVNPWTGLLKYEHRFNCENYDDGNDIYYDFNGVEKTSGGYDSWYPSAELQHLTEYTGCDELKNPTGSTTTYGSARTVTVSSQKTVDTAAEVVYLPLVATEEFHMAKHITKRTITYTGMTPEGPTGATVEDDFGSEVWELNGGYENSSLKKRTRTTKGGSVTTWTYTDTPAGKFHTRADITYSNLDGLHTGTGWETYTTSGIMDSRHLRNTTSHTWDEDITYSNDGQYITTGTGTRADGVTVTYNFVGANDISSMEDDHGLTTYDPATHKRTTVSGSMGDFTYVYDGDVLVGIEGSNMYGKMKFDQYWNLKEWTDTKNVVHTYTPTAYNNVYWTKATETFTDLNHTNWTGDVEYASTGFYFKKETLRATNAKVDGSGAVNVVDMDENGAYEAIKQMMLKYYAEMETFTWAPKGDTRKATSLGALKNIVLKVSDLTGFADAIVYVMGDGSTTADFSNIRFKDKEFIKVARYKPTYTTSTSTVITEPDAEEPGEEDNRNMTLYNAVYQPGVVGDYSYVTGSRTVKIDGKDKTEWTITTEHWIKSADGFEWQGTGKDIDNYFADTVHQETGKITAAPVGSKDGYKVTSSANRFYYRTSWGNKAAGVTLAGSPVAPEPVVQGKRKIQVPEQPAVQASSASDIAEETVAKAKTGDSAKATRGTGKSQAAAPASQDDLAIALANVHTIADAADFLALVASKFSGQAVLNALQDSSAANVMKALVVVYKAVFGEAYQASLLGKLLELALNNTAVMDEMKIALIGDSTVPAELRLAAKIAQDLQAAQNVKKDEQGRVVEAVDERGATHQYQYEASGLTETIQGADGNVRVKHFDPAGQLLSETADGKSRTLSYAKNAAGQVSSTTVVERSTEGVATMVYDTQGRLLNLEQNGRKTEFEYSGQGTKNYQAKLYSADGKKVTEEQSYQNGRLTQRKRLDDGTTVKYNYLTDDAGKVLALTQVVEDKDGGKTFLKYDGEGRLVSALGKDADRFEKMAEEEGMAEQALAFELEKQLFGDPRMDGKRIDSLQLLDGFSQEQERQ